MAALDGSAGIFKFTDRKFTLAAFLTFRHNLEESPDVRNILAGNAAAFIRAFEFFNVEAYAVPSGFQEKIDDLFRMKKRLRSDHGNCMERNGVALKSANALHHLGVRAVALAVFSMRIVNRRRAIHAHAHVDRPFVKEIAPLIVDEHSIGLKGVAYGEGIAARCQRGKDFFVITRCQHQRFAGMPNHAQVGPDCARSNKAVDNVDRLCRLHFLGAQPVGKVAVVAVDIAKRCRLQHQQLNSSIV